MDKLITLSLHLATIFSIILLLWSFKVVKINWALLSVFGACYCTYYVALIYLGPFINRSIGIPFSYNWLGKIFSILFWLFSAYILLKTHRNFYLSKIGFTFSQNHGSIIPSILVFLFLITACHFGGSFSFENIEFENMLFQSLMPGLDEELGFRGVLLFLLSIAIASKEVKVLSAPVNAASLIIALLFGLVHGLSYSNNNINLSVGAVIYTGMVGLSFLWVRLRTGSVVLPIIMHNLFNVTNQFFVW